MFDNIKLKAAMRDLKNGHNNAIDYIYDVTHRMVYYQIYQIIKRRDVSEDIMQDVYMKVFQNIGQYSEQNQPKSWILSIARNEALNQYKKRKRETVVDIDTLNQKSYDQTASPIIDLASQILDEDEFIIVMSCIVDQKTRKAVGKLLNLSTSGVTFKLNVALDKLKNQLEGGTKHD
ncbi:MAG: hypothetical protein CVV63_03585 [Tenericutes bacterium HGW-Tenericutes-8]|nr:MAG: hypothetical protein CVV63_03585 [Tenericutes bacterium HGW-Tenericutes-8]